jgi:hypothetical protein
MLIWKLACQIFIVIETKAAKNQMHRYARSIKITLVLIDKMLKEDDFKCQ